MFDQAFVFAYHDLFLSTLEFYHQNIMVLIMYSCSSVNVNGVFGLFDLCLSDIIDVDKEKYKRRYLIKKLEIFTLTFLIKSFILL